MSGSLEPNTSMYQSLAAPQAAGSAVANPMAMAQGFQNIQRTALENNQMAQQQTARMAIGQAAQQAYDPSTGQVDNKKLVGLISQDPRASFMAQDVQNAITARELQQQQISNSQLENGIKVAENMTGQLGTMVNDPHLTREKVMDVMHSYLDMAPHSMALPVVMKALAAMPPDNSPASIQELRQQLASWQTGFKNTADSFKMAHPDFVPVNQGDRITFTSPSAWGQPAGAVGNSFRMGLTPDASTTVAGQAVNPQTGQSFPVTKGALFAAQQGQGGAAGEVPGGLPPGVGGGGAIGGGGQAGQGGGGPNPLGWGQGAATGTARQAPPGGPANGGAVDVLKGRPVWNPQPTPTAPFNPAQAMASGQAASSLTPAQEATQKATADTFNSNRTDLSNKLDAQSQVTQVMTNEEKLLSLMRTGPGAGNAQKLGQAMQAIGNTTGMTSLVEKGKALSADPNNPQAHADATSAAQAFGSIMYQNVANQSKGMFKDGGTQAEVMGLLESYINPSTTPQARGTIFNIARQRRDQLLAENIAAGSFRDVHKGEAAGPDWNDFQTQWAAHSQHYGISSTGMDPKGVIAPVGDTKGLLASVGMHPESSAQEGPAPQAAGRPSWVPANAVYVAKHSAWYAPKSNGKMGRVDPPGGQ